MVDVIERYILQQWSMHIAPTMYTNQVGDLLSYLLTIQPSPPFPSLYISLPALPPRLPPPSSASASASAFHLPLSTFRYPPLVIIAASPRGPFLTRLLHLNAPTKHAVAAVHEITEGTLRPAPLLIPLLLAFPDLPVLLQLHRGTRTQGHEGTRKHEKAREKGMGVCVRLCPSPVLGSELLQTEHDFTCHVGS